jgi:hypothetical protein
MHEPLLGVLFVYLSSFSPSLFLKFFVFACPHNCLVFFLLPFTASVFGACVCVCTSKRYKIDGAHSYLLPRNFLNQKLRRAMP